VHVRLSNSRYRITFHQSDTKITEVEGAYNNCVPCFKKNDSHIAAYIADVVIRTDMLDELQRSRESTRATGTWTMDDRNSRRQEETGFAWFRKNEIISSCKMGVCPTLAFINYKSSNTC
jgi:hypothetical protein